MSRIRVVLDVDKIDYRRLKGQISENLQGVGKIGANLGLSALDLMDEEGANKVLVSLGNRFHNAVLDALNQQAFDFGVRFSDVSFRMSD